MAAPQIVQQSVFTEVPIPVSSPGRGKRAFVCPLDFSKSASGFTWNLLIQQWQDVMSAVTCVYIDNSANAQSFQLIINVTQQVITAQPGTQGYYAVIVPSTFQFTALSTGSTAIVPLFILNYTPSNTVWGQSTSPGTQNVNIVSSITLPVSIVGGLTNPLPVQDGPAEASLVTIAGATSTLATTVTAGKIAENLTQVAGTAIDVNSGNKSAGTQRVVLATDQPSLTNPLLANTVVRTPKIYFANNINATQSNIITGANLYAIKSILITPRASSSAATGANYFVLLSDSSAGIFLIINVWMAPLNAQPSLPIVIGPSNQPFFQSVVNASTLTLTINSAPTGGGMDVTIGYELI